MVSISEPCSRRTHDPNTYSAILTRLRPRVSPEDTEQRFVLLRSCPKTPEEVRVERDLRRKTEEE